MITENQFKNSAVKLKCEVAAIKAVAEVESGGSGFLPTGEPVILFEPHVFWKRLRAKGLDPAVILKQHPEVSDILYPTWGSKPYGRSSQQHARLQRACNIHRDAAIESASWGKFQILGLNYKMCGANYLQDFINAVYASEDMHLNLFVEYIINANLDDELRAKDWKGLARGYNGPLYWKNSYDRKLATAYKKYAA